MSSTGTLGPDTAVPRDRWRAPLIAEDDSGDLVPYAQPSSLGKVLTDTTALRAWDKRQTALGVAASPAIVAALATCDPDDRRALDALVSQALERAGTSDAATIGTAVHAACEAVDLGRPIPNLPPQVADAVTRYAHLIDTHGLQPLPAWCELFVASRDLRAAGTADRFYRLPDGRVVVGDLKTSKPGAEKYAALEWAVQLACYANGTPYRHPGVWGTPHPDLDPTVGVVVHVPSTIGAPAHVHQLDLVAGLELARLAVQVRAARKVRPLTTWGSGT